MRVAELRRRLAEKIQYVATSGEEEAIATMLEYGRAVLITLSQHPDDDELLADGTVGAYGLSIQEIQATDAFSHFTWISVPSFAAYEKARSAYTAHRMSLSVGERKALMKKLASITDPDASRSMVFREEIFHVASAD